MTKLLLIALLAAAFQDPGATPAAQPAAAPDEPARAPERQEPARQEPSPAVEPPKVAAPEPAAAPALAWDGAAPKSPEELEPLLARFAAAWPADLRVQAVGVARDGAKVWRASVTRAAQEEEGRLPALVTLPATSGAVDGAALARSLAACAALCERLEREPELQARFARGSVQFLFAAEPARTFRGAAPALDYPVGWTNGPDRPPHPLFEPETRAIAEFLLAHPAIGVLASETGAATPNPFVLGREAERAAPGGSLERFGREYLGAGLATWSAVGEGGAVEGALAAERLVRLFDALPRLEVGAPSLERARPALWILECELVNRGAAGTLEGPAAQRERSSAWLDVVGAELAAVAIARGGKDAVFEPVGARGPHVELGHLAGGETVRLRLVLRGTEGAEAKLSVRSLRAGSADVAATLR